MENDKKTREPLDDDALGAVAGGSGIPDLVIKRPELHISVSSPKAPSPQAPGPVHQQVHDPIPDYKK